MSEQPRRGMTLEENQPDYEDESKRPKTLTKSRHIDGVLYVAGRAPREKTEYEIMFITTAVEEDEAATQAVSTFGFRVSQPAEYLKGANGVVKDVALMAGVDMDECYYTAVCKWLLPRAQRARPSKKLMKWGLPIVEDEIARMKPKIIVCLGKPVFDLVSDQKINFKDAHGCWFWNEQYQAHMYVMHAPYTLVGNPEHYETFRIDFREIARRRDILRDGGKITGAEVNYQVINDEASLADWLDHIEELASGPDWPGWRDDDGDPLLAVDCEWHGKTHVDGQLRTMQVAWSETDSVVIEFRNEENEWSFDVGQEAMETWLADQVRAAGGSDTTPVGLKTKYAELMIDVVKGEAVMFPTLAEPAPIRGASVSNMVLDDLAFKGEDETAPPLHYGPTPPGEDWEGYEELDEGVWRAKLYAAPQDEEGNNLSAWAAEVCTHEDAKFITEAERVVAREGAGSEDEEPYLAGFEIVPKAAGGPKLVGEHKAHVTAPVAAVDEELRRKCAAPREEDVIRYAAVGRPIAGTFDRMNAKFIGHHFSADAVWMRHWLGIETYERCAMDTEFAQQTVDESSELGLERGIAMKYTNLGRYDQDLVMWKRENKELCKGGYGYIPSAILYLYGALDVVTPYRAYPMIKRQLEAQKLWDYYRNIFNPFVTDVFTEFSMTGLPMDIPLMDDLRNLFTWTTARLNKKLQERIANEAVQQFKSRVMAEFGVVAVKEVWSLIDERDEIGLKTAIKELLSAKEKMKDVTTWNSMIHHLVESPRFNIRSPDQMARWLFDFEGLTPIKSTNQKAKGLPSMAWEKVLELPKDRQALYKPAVDKQTLSILAEQLDTLDELLDLNAVGNLSKAFLNEPDVYIDGDTGEEVVEEHGLHAWLCSDGRIHGQMSTTETGRPRSWAPNTLNYPSYVNKRIAKTVERCIREAHEEGDLPDDLTRWVGIPGEDLPSIRSCIKAPEGMVLVESDYATAEMVALAVISGDKDLMRLLNDPDPEWARLKPGHWTGAEVVRVAFADPKTTGVPEAARNEKFLMNVWDAGEHLGSVAPEELMRDESGAVMYAKYDIHWSLIERTYERYRETMKAKVDRAAAKVLNFSSAYGASSNSLERKIESDTGVKPAEGTGDRGLEAIAERQPRATQFLEMMARVPKEKGFYRAASGRIRHCPMHAAGSGVGWRTRNAIESSLGRQLRNFGMQESVGSTSARACKWLLSSYRRLGLKARPMTCLYDSVVTLCPLEERFLVSRLHNLCMSELNLWYYDDDEGKRTLQYSIDNEFNWKWSTRPKKEDRETLDDRGFHPPSAAHAMLEKHPNLASMVGLAHVLD